MQPSNVNNLKCFPNTYALVLCGGKSERMGKDKSLLIYKHKPQRYLLYDMLLHCCEKVFISCNSIQSKSIDESYSFMQDDDCFREIGPMGALLTAFQKYPSKNILLVACDYPYLTIDDLQSFSMYCHENSAAFYNNYEKLYVPVLGWYCYKDRNAVTELYKAGNTSLQKYLTATNAYQYKPVNEKCMCSVDTLEEYFNTTRYNIAQLVVKK